MVYDASVFKPNYEKSEKSFIHDQVGYAVIPAGRFVFINSSDNCWYDSYEGGGLDNSLGAGLPTL